MKHLLKPLAVVAAVATSFALLSSTASAQTLVQWGEATNIVTSTVNASTTNSITASTVTPVNPGANVNGYYDGTLSPTGRTAIFYGAVYNDLTQSPSGVHRLQVTNDNTNGDYINFDFSGVANDHTHAGLAFWQKSDGFLNTTITADFADVEFDLVTGVNAARSGQNVYFVVRQGASDFYVSNALGPTVGGFGTKTFTESDVSTWSSYTPTTNILTIGATATPTLDNVTAFGYLFTSIDANLTSTGFRVEQFSVTVIPEPSSALLLGLGGIALIALRRRRAA